MSQISHEIVADNRSVWVSGRDGSCLGRFGQLGVDVHRSASEQLEGAPECLVCTHGRVTAEDWALFVEAMAKHHGIDDGEQFRPGYLSGITLSGAGEFAA